MTTVARFYSNESALQSLTPQPYTSLPEKKYSARDAAPDAEPGARGCTLEVADGGGGLEPAGRAGHGQQQRRGRQLEGRPGLAHRLLLDAVAARAPPEDRRVQEGLVVLRHRSGALGFTCHTLRRTRGCCSGSSRSQRADRAILVFTTLSHWLIEFESRKRELRAQFC